MELRDAFRDSLYDELSARFGTDALPLVLLEVKTLDLYGPSFIVGIAGAKVRDADKVWLSMAVAVSLYEADFERLGFDYAGWKSVESLEDQVVNLTSMAKVSDWSDYGNGVIDGNEFRGRITTEVA